MGIVIIFVVVVVHSQLTLQLGSYFYFRKCFNELLVKQEQEQEQEQLEMKIVHNPH